MRVVMMRGMMVSSMRVGRRAGVWVSVIGVVTPVSALVGGWVLVMLEMMRLRVVVRRVHFHMMNRGRCSGSCRLKDTTPP